MVANKLLTLVFVRNQSKILLGYKKRGCGMGRWNGFGGKVEKGESIVEGAVRELSEESEIVATTSSLSKIGLLMFEFKGDPQLLEVHVYSTTDYTGEPAETSEMRPQWYDIENIPYEKMWTDDKIWIPLMLANKKFKGYFMFEGMHTIVKQNLEEVTELL